MKIAIISDSHDNVPNLDEALRVIKEKKVEAIIHCGDVCAPSVLKYLGENFSGAIHLTYGNVDGDQPKMVELATPNTIIHGDVGQLNLGGKKLLSLTTRAKAKNWPKAVNMTWFFTATTIRPGKKLSARPNWPTPAL